MNLLIRAANIYTPTPLKRKKLLELFACTSWAFACEMPPVEGLPYGELLPLTAAERETLHSARLPANLYVADATLIPKSLGNPPILTIIALAKRVSRMVECT